MGKTKSWIPKWYLPTMVIKLRANTISKVFFEKAKVLGRRYGAKQK